MRNAVTCLDDPSEGEFPITLAFVYNEEKEDSWGNNKNKVLWDYNRAAKSKNNVPYMSINHTQLSSSIFLEDILISRGRKAVFSDRRIPQGRTFGRLI